MDVDIPALKSLMQKLNGLDEAESARFLAQVGHDDPVLLTQFKALIEGARHSEENRQALMEKPALQDAISKASKAPRVVHLASALEQMGSGSAGLISKLSAAAPGLAEALKQAMFSFGDLSYADSRGLQILLSKLDKKTLRYALRGSDEDLAEVLYGQMSKRAAEQLREDVELMGRVRKREVLDAQGKVTALARKMMKEGELIVIKPDDAEEWVP